MSVDPIRRPLVRLSGPALLRCPCGGVIVVADAAEPLVCRDCGAHWRLRFDLTEVAAAGENVDAVAPGSSESAS